MTTGVLSVTDLNSCARPAPGGGVSEILRRTGDPQQLGEGLGRAAALSQHDPGHWRLLLNTQYSGPGALQSANTVELCFCQLTLAKVL